MNQTTNAVYVGTNRDTAILLNDAISRQPKYSFSSVEQLSAVGEKFSNGDSAIILLDRDLANKLPNDFPFVVVSAETSVDGAIELLKAGASDVVTIGTERFKKLPEILDSAMEACRNQNRQRESRVVLDQTLHLARTILDSVGTGIGILDEQGNLLSTNLAWRNNTDEGNLFGAGICKSQNYLEFCSNSKTDNAAELKQMIEQVLDGRSEMDSIEYKCQDKIFKATALGAEDLDVARAVLFLDDISGDKINESIKKSRLSAKLRVEKLTRRELQVMELVVAGRPNKAIANELEISIKTVEMHRSNMMRKLGVISIPDLVRLAIMYDGSITQPVAFVTGRQTSRADDDSKENDRALTS